MTDDERSHWYPLPRLTNRQSLRCIYFVIALFFCMIPFNEHLQYIIIYHLHLPVTDPHPPHSPDVCIRPTACLRTLPPMPSLRIHCHWWMVCKIITIIYFVVREKKSELERDQYERVWMESGERNNVCVMKFHSKGINLTPCLFVPVLLAPPLSLSLS